MINHLTTPNHFEF